MIIFSYVFILILIFFWGLNFLSLPGNWLIILSLAGVDFFSSQINLGPWSWVLLIGLGIAGEALEWIGQYWGGKKFGLSSRGNIAAIIGAIVGSILGVPFFLGFGAILGALLGAYLASFLVEYLADRSMAKAHQKALGAFWGKALGLVAKLGIGMAILVIAIPKLTSF